MEKRKYTKDKFKPLETLLPEYLEQKITRDEIIKKLSLTKAELRNYLRRKNIKIWDFKKKRSNYKEFLSDARKYEKGKMTIMDIANKHNLSVGTVKNKLRELNIETYCKKKLKESKGKYYNIKEECNSNEYARFFYEFNK